jgi:glycosyltransferase involved in cell wall biosynthesis
VIRDHLRRCRALLFPGEEDFGIVPVEAMACGTPVLATGAGGSGEFLRDGENCLLFERGDPAALAEGVRRLAADPTLRRRIAVGGLATANELTSDHLADTFEAWHRAAAERFRSALPPARELSFRAPVA